MSEHDKTSTSAQFETKENNGSCMLSVFWIMTTLMLAFIKLCKDKTGPERLGIHIDDEDSLPWKVSPKHGPLAPTPFV